MKKFISTIFLLSLIYLIFTYHTQIIQFIMVNIIYKDSLFMQETNLYTRDENWLYVQKTDNFYPKNKQDILNLFYTALDSGWDEVTFYCDEQYTTCLDDMKAMMDDNYIFSHINDLVTTLNSYHQIYVTMNLFGRVNIHFEHLYTDEQKHEIEAKVDELYQNLITPYMDNTEKIRVIHDYLIQHTTYDKERAAYTNLVDPFYVTTSNTALGPLLTGKAVCGGYTDAMALFLDKMGIRNYKIANSKHIWNFVYINGEWKHLDLTWDDPVMDSGKETLLHTFFLISTDELKKIDQTQHVYDSNIYLEAK